MKSIRLLVLLLGILLVLPAAVVLRSGVALADVDPPTKEEITAHCANEIYEFAMTVVMLQHSGVKLEKVLADNPKLPKSLVDLVKSLYANDEKAMEAAVNASMAECISFYSAKTARKA